jgi:hypothetical protein
LPNQELVSFSTAICDHTFLRQQHTCSLTHIFLSFFFLALATAEAAAARKISHLQSKMEVAEAMHRESKTKLDESNAARHAANMSLTSLVSEKEKLMKENKDLNAVCEELMAIVEGGGENLAAD